MERYPHNSPSTINTSTKSMSMSISTNSKIIEGHSVQGHSANTSASCAGPGSTSALGHTNINPMHSPASKPSTPTASKAVKLEKHDSNMLPSILEASGVKEKENVDIDIDGCE